MENNKNQNNQTTTGVATTNTTEKITVVDLGNMFVKYISNSGIKGSFSSKIYSGYMAYKEGYERIEKDGKFTFVGVGELDREFNKVNKLNIEQLLYAIAKANPLDEILFTKLCLLLPLSQMENKKKLEEDLKGKEFIFKVNDKDRIVTVSDLLVLPEGYASYFSLSDDDKKGDVCILDLGSRTINLCLLENGKISKTNTVRLGSFDFYSRVKAEEKNEDFTEEEIPRLINNGTIKITLKELGIFLNEILNAVKPYVNLRTYKVIWCGGTSKMLEDVISKLTFMNQKVLEDGANSNIIGALRASEKVWNLGA